MRASPSAKSRYASDSEHGLEDRPRPAARQHGCGRGGAAGTAERPGRPRATASRHRRSTASWSRTHRRSRCCAGTATSANRGAARRAPGETGIAERDARRVVSAKSTAAHAACFSRRTSGATASSTSALSATSSGSTLWPSLPRRRIETVRSAASLRPTTSRAGTLASECSRTL